MAKGWLIANGWLRCQKAYEYSHHRGRLERRADRYILYADGNAGERPAAGIDQAPAQRPVAADPAAGARLLHTGTDPPAPAETPEERGARLERRRVLIEAQARYLANRNT